MPELPEVQTIVNDLKKYAVNAEITDVVIERTYNVIPGNDQLIANTKGHIITDVRRIAKNIVMEVSSGHSLVIHLAMTGRLLLRKPEHQPEPHERVRLILTKKENVFHLRFADMRKFGKVQLIHNNGLNVFTEKYGPEPVEPGLTPEKFLELLTSKKTVVKNVLLDQQIISGLGNVYATDALWMAGIHPETPTKNLNLNHAERLLSASREILNEGIKNRGISMSDYVDLFEKKGSQQNFFRIYRKEECPICKNKTTFKKIGGRGTYYCETCQPKATPLFG